jgi:hypothetical protein
MTSDKPVYFLPPEHPSIAAWKDNFELLSAQADKKFTINIGPDLVEELNVFGIQEMILALQYYPQHIEKFLFGFEFHFQQVAKSNLFYPGRMRKNTGSGFSLSRDLCLFSFSLKIMMPGFLH